MPRKSKKKSGNKPVNKPPAEASMAAAADISPSSPSSIPNATVADTNLEGSESVFEIYTEPDANEKDTIPLEEDSEIAPTDAVIPENVGAGIEENQELAQTENEGTTSIELSNADEVSSPGLAAAHEESIMTEEQKTGYEEVSDFGEQVPEQITRKEPPAQAISDDEDDFGSFDEASIEDISAAEDSASVDTVFDQAVFQNALLLNARLDEVVEQLLPDAPSMQKSPAHLLNEHASEKFQKLSEAPRLQPPSWVKSSMRSNLLQNLGLPADLEEVESTPMMSYRFAHSSRTKPSSEHDIDWSAIELPSLDSLTISAELKSDFINNPASVLAALEDDAALKFTKQSLENCSTDVLEQKVKALSAHHSKLLQLCAVGKENIEELRRSQAVFESVVENLVGYNQKVQRNELLERLSRSKNKKGKKTF